VCSLLTSLVHLAYGGEWGSPADFGRRTCHTDARSALHAHVTQMRAPQHTHVEGEVLPAGARVHQAGRVAPRAVAAISAAAAARVADPTAIQSFPLAAHHCQGAGELRRNTARHGTEWQGTRGRMGERSEGKQHVLAGGVGRMH
jgi:hypothetical protein